MGTNWGFSMLFVVGFGIIGWGMYCALKSRIASNWPTVSGEIKSCEIKKTTDVDGDTYRVLVSYSYEVFGRQYQGDRIAFGYSGTNSHAEHASLYDKLSMARKVAVRFNPSNPAESALTFGLKMPMRVLVFGFMWVLFMTGFSILWKQSSHSSVWILTLLVLPTGASALWMLSRKSGKSLLDGIEIQ
jgi:hypothetical protein